MPRGFDEAIMGSGLKIMVTPRAWPCVGEVLLLGFTWVELASSNMDRVNVMGYGLE
jgi:hypothetical protein